MKKRKIYFIHEGKEAYPEIAAYQHAFHGLYETEIIHPCALYKKKDLQESICWFLMGLYPRRPESAFVIHDYRSLSVGKTRTLKDFLKKKMNAKPDLRIFQNEILEEKMGFQDKVPFFLLPMGVEPEIVEARATGGAHEESIDFAYAGTMARDRDLGLMIDSFLLHYQESRSFHLFGKPDPKLMRRYKDNPNVIFEGFLKQETLFQKLQEARVAVNFFPTHEPHAFQTPTKLLEYAALGMRILSNEHPRSREAAKLYGIQSFWRQESDLFAALPDLLDWEDNKDLNPQPFFWPYLIKSSGLPDFLDKISREET